MSALKGAAASLTKTAAPKASVEELVLASRGGDRGAFETLYERYRAATHGVALSYVPADAAGDVVQEAFARALAKLGSLREPSRFGGWLMTIARNAALDAVRHRGRHRADTEADDVAASDPPRVEVARVLTVLRTLPTAYRESLLMRLVEGMSGAEIAEKTGMTPGSVRVNLHRGMTMLRAKLGDAP